MSSKAWHLEVFRWRWVSIPLLGISINFFVNWIFNFRTAIDTVHLDEYLIAILFALIALESIRKSNRIIERKFLQGKSELTVLASLFLFDIVLLAVVINGIGSLYTLLVYGSTYSAEEYLVINLIAISFTSIFVLAELYIQTKKQKIHQFRATKPIQVHFKNAQKWVLPEEIKACFTENGLTYIIASDRRYLADHTLNELVHLLPKDSFSGQTGNRFSPEQSLIRLGRQSMESLTFS